MATVPPALTETPKWKWENDEQGFSPYNSTVQVMLNEAYGVSPMHVLNWNRTAAYFMLSWLSLLLEGSQSSWAGETALWGRPICDRLSYNETGLGVMWANCTVCSCVNGSAREHRNFLSMVTSCPLLNSRAQRACSTAERKILALMCKNVLVPHLNYCVGFYR